MTPEQLMLDLEFRRVAQPLVAARAWRIESGAFQRRDREKADLLAAIVGCGRAMTVELSDDPGSESLRILEPLGELSYRFRDDASLSSLQIVLGQGGWILHDGATTLTEAKADLGGPMPTAEALLSVVDRHRLGILVVSFFDDAVWTIGVRTPSSEP